MTPLVLFFNRYGRLRSGWRVLFFVCAFIAVYYVAASFFGDQFRLTLLLMATLVGWWCGWLFEGLPLRALGWSFHRNWLYDFWLGSLLGGGSLILATLVASAFGGFHFTFTLAGWGALKSLGVSAALFVIAAAAEEALFRGYPLQTMLRAWPVWFALIPSTLFFASVHLLNPHAVRGFTFINTALAGVWLAVGYWRTRSLWFPLGLHWSWNWTMGSLLGLPVSGVTRLSQTLLLRATDAGPSWLTGGDYGIEGGAACTVVVIISIIFLSRTRLVAATPELKSFTDAETPSPRMKNGEEHL